MPTPRLLALLLASALSVPAAPDLAQVCLERTWQTRLPWHTPRWDSVVAKPDRTRPHRWIDDTVSQFVFVSCRSGWLTLLSPDGEVVLTHVASSPGRKPATGGGAKGVVVDLGAGSLDPREPGEAKASAPPPSERRRSSGKRKKESSGIATDGLLGEAEDGDRMAPIGAIGLGSGGRGGSLDNPSAVHVLSEETAPPPPAPTPAAGRDRPRSSGLQAGVSDDNKQFPSFLEFLAKRRPAGSGLDSRVGERIALRVVDSADRPVLGARVVVRSGGKLLEEGRTLADGSYLLFPLAMGDASARGFDLEIQHEAGSIATRVERDGPRSHRLRLAGNRKSGNLVVDLLFVLDVTGSMQAQIDQLKNAIAILQMNLSSMPQRPVLRFGLVQYQDRYDEFRVRHIPFTTDAAIFSQALASVQSGDGGDTPEDLQSALDTALHRLRWSPEGIRLGFVVTDAMAHLDYGQTFTYVDAAHEARRRGIKFHTVGCGSLGIDGEALLRQIAQATSGKYVFLTRAGESGESDGGTPGSVSHHTGSNWTSERLETALLRLARDEIAQQALVPPVDSLGWFEARSTSGQAADSILLDLFRQAWKELLDYSTLPVPPQSTLAVLTPVPAAASLAPQAARLGQELALAISRAGGCKLVDRGNLGEVLRELSLQHSGAVEDSSVRATGKLLGADLLITSGLHSTPRGHDLILKLLRVSTGELLSATRARIDPALLP